jgi:uncharacterized protein (TIGR03083 family)
MHHERLCTEIVDQTRLLVATVQDCDLRVPVPSCPDWTLGMLLRHIGGGHRWAEEIVRTQAGAFRADDQLRKLHGDDSGPAPVGWLEEGATRLADALMTAGPDLTVWTPLDIAGTTSFWSRRFAHETLIHRADASLAVGSAFTVTAPVAVDAIDEWMELGALPVHFEYRPGLRDVLGPGRTLGFEATDGPGGRGTGRGPAWVVDLTGDVVRWRRGPEPTAVTVRAPLTELLLTVYRRRPAERAEVEISGDRDLLRLWLGHVGFA